MFFVNIQKISIKIDDSNENNNIFWGVQETY